MQPANSTSRVPAVEGAFSGTSFTSLISGILDDIQSLLKQQVGIFKAEITTDVDRLKLMAKCFALAGILFTFAVLFFLFTMVYLIHDLAPSLPMSACWAIVTGIITLFTIIAGLIGYRNMKKFSPIPTKSIESLEENISWATNQQK